MGVKGLWSLLNPVARPVQIESMEGKRMAIDSSIWLYQFQATMRDKDGRVLVNAHVLGFLRRINKLLFHGIKPVFVFDGGAPVLKRNTIAERKRRKAGAAANHARMAEKLFAAQMRREAVKVAQTAKDQEAARREEEAAAAAARYNDDEGERIAEGAVYLEDLEQPGGPSRPRPPPAGTTPARRPVTPPPDPREERRKKFKKHDPYRLPETSMPTVSTEEKPDARLATEDELKQFIDEVHPEDIDIESPEFRALPTEVQYEIVGDMRVRSRQTSHRRLADMLRAAPTALDFSMAQIKNLSQRNALTQQLLTVTDMVGQAHLTIPVRIAAERNREYVLVKRDEASGGGWALGIREGSKEKPIELDKDVKPAKREDDAGYSDSDYDSSEVEELAPPSAPSRQTTDPDLRELRRREVLEAIAARYAPQKAARPPLDIEPKAFGRAKRPGAAPLFDSIEDDEEQAIVPSANDEALALALQQEELGSEEDEADEDLAKALAMSRREAESADGNVKSAPSIGSPKSELSEDSMEEVSLEPSRVPTPQNLSQSQTPIQIDDNEDDEDFVEVEGPLAPFTLPAVTNAAPSKARPASGPRQSTLRNPVPPRDRQARSHDHAVAASALSTEPVHVVNDTKALDEVDRRLTSKGADREPAEASPSRPPKPLKTTASTDVALTPALPITSHSRTITQEMGDDDDITAVEPPSSSRLTEAAVQQLSNATKAPEAAAPKQAPPEAPAGAKPTHALSIDAPFRNANQPNIPQKPILSRQLSRVSSHHPSPAPRSRASSIRSASKTPAREAEPEDPDNLTNALLGVRPTRPVDRHSYMEMAEESVPSSYQGSALGAEDEEEETEADGAEREEDDEDDEGQIPWSRSPSPVARPPLQPAQSGETIPSEVEDNDEDMAPAEMVAEQDDYARFMASIRNRDLNEVRGEIDDEIRVLHNQNKLAMRDSDEITQAMVAQIQTLLRHYGIPYITAPMEAEAQCAKLAELGLVDGIITDDSDVFLFGGIQCFKNIFNDAKYAECFILSDIERELSLTRERLISLAYLLGSDYTIGLPGVGPVVALELLSNFPGPTGLDDFKLWWTKVQRGQDSESDTNTKWKKSFKKRFAPTILLTAEWPNHLVREAYKYPTTDESEEPFHWGFPKLSALRAFLHEELSWSISKVDDELTPIVQRIARRGKVGALNKQATLDPFFDLSAGQGNFAPRRRTTANVSKRLMAVIKDFREAEARVIGGPDPEWSEMMKTLDAEDPKGKGTGKRRKSQTAEAVEGEVEKPKKPRRQKSGSAITTPKGDEGGVEPVKKRGRPRRNTASTASTSDLGTSTGDGSLASTKDEVDSGSARAEQIAVPKHGLRGSATGVVGAGKRKKAALTAWRNSTKSKDLAPTTYEV